MWTWITDDWMQNAERVWVQQCPVGLDANPDSYPHLAHRWDHRSGKGRWCRGWFPSVSTTRGGIRYPGGTLASGSPRGPKEDTCTRP